MSCKLLEFNANKCRVMLLSKKRRNSIPSPPIYLNGVVLSRVTTYKYLGVIISHNLSWKPHITTICNKTKRLIGTIYRKFYGYSNPVTLLKLYLIIIRSNLEYASSVWDPSQKLQIDALESVQKFGLRMCLKSWNENYDDLLIRSKIPSLKTRRMRMKLCHLFKIIKKMTEFPDAPIAAKRTPYQNRSINNYYLTIPWAYQYSFFPNALGLWNGLPEDTQCQ